MKFDSSHRQQPRSPMRVNRHPSGVVDITCPDCGATTSVEPRADQAPVVEVLHEAHCGWMERPSDCGSWAETAALAFINLVNQMDTHDAEASLIDLAAAVGAVEAKIRIARAYVPVNDAERRRRDATLDELTQLSDEIDAWKTFFNKLLRAQRDLSLPN